jgi:hypothetical protein
MRSMLTSVFAVTFAIVVGALAGGAVAFALTPAGLTVRSPELVPCTVLGVLVSGVILGWVRHGLRFSIWLGTAVALAIVCLASAIFPAGPMNVWRVLYPVLVLVAPIVLGAVLATAVIRARKSERNAQAQTA